MERLTEWYDDGQQKGILVKEYPAENSLKTLYQKFGEQNDYSACEEGYLGMERLKAYEDAEENGLLLKLPCKVGTHIYIINHYWIDEGHICGLAECDDVDCACFKVYEDPDTYTMVAFNEFGQTWFLTEEKAEQKLKELQD